MHKLDEITIAFIVNPYAGLGGEAGLKGSDGEEIRQQALHYHGHQPASQALDNLPCEKRVVRFLQALNHGLEQRLEQVTTQSSTRKLNFFTGPGKLGAMQLAAAGFEHLQNLHKADFVTDNSAQDTKQLVRSALEHSVDLIVFAGGDGTARDVLDVVGDENPNVLCLGVPAGVKMQSAVFAISPEAAAQVLLAWRAGELPGVAMQDVRDLDEAALRNNQVRSSYYGALNVLAAPRFLQHLKMGGFEQDELVLDEIAEHIIALQDDAVPMLMGPGSTIAHIMAQLGLANTLVGFDLVVAGELVASDLNAKACEQALIDYPELHIVLTPTGQQGFLLGRGNQQISPQVIATLDKSRWLIVATKEKLASLAGRPLLVDTNDLAINAEFAGWYSVISAFEETVLYPVDCTYN